MTTPGRPAGGALPAPGIPARAAPPGALPRRHALAWLAASTATAVWPGSAEAHAQLGPVEPRRPAPSLSLTLHTGERQTLPALLRGKVTAVQLMFTGCSAVCPLQGATFAALQQHLAGGPTQARLLSVSIDPLSDDAPALAAWRGRFGAGERWLSGAPPVAQADWLLDFVEGRRNGADRHSAQTFLFDAQGRFAYRLAELASAADIAQALRQLARRG